MKWRYLYSVLLVLCSVTLLTSAVGDDNKDHLPQYYEVRQRNILQRINGMRERELLMMV